MDYETIIDEQLESMELSELEGLIESTSDYYGIMDDVSIDGIIANLINGTPLFDTETFMDNLVELFPLAFILRALAYY